MTTSGPCPAPLMILGESWGKHEELDPEHRPFQYAAGWELDRMLSEGGISRSDCFVANVVNARPPGDKIEQFFYKKREAKLLGREPVYGLFPNDVVIAGLSDLARSIARCQPKLILALGNVALWAVTGGRTRRPDEKTAAPTGILRWRSSQLGPEELEYPTLCVPTIHPAAILREYSLRPLVVHDIQRAKRTLEHGIQKPNWTFHIRPSFRQVLECIEFLKEHRRLGKPIACDTERRLSQISCIGFAWSNTEAICIPLMMLGDNEGYWSFEEELEIVFRLRELLTLDCDGPLIFQNGGYDLQEFARQFGYLPLLTDDTMLMQHVLFPGLRKGLDFLSSMYCEYHRYWKDDGKYFDPRTHDEEQHWIYNAEDCVRTMEAYGVLNGLIGSFGRNAQYRFQIRLLHSAVRMMLRGVRVDVPAKKEMGRNLDRMLQDTEQWINAALGRDFNCRSNPQMVDLFYDEMGCKPIKKRGKDGWHLTCEDEALDKIKVREPILAPLVDKIKEYRSIGVFKSNYAEMRLPPDKRMRSTINVAGPETFRFSMSEDIEGYGGNLQTLPKGTEDD